MGYASVVTTMPSGYSALGFSAQAGFTLAIDGCGALIKAELTTPPLTTSAAALITGSVSAGCLQYDVDARAYNKIDIESYTVGTKTIVVKLPQAVTYLFAAVSANAQIPTFYNKTRATSSTTASLSFPGGFVLDVSTSSANTVTVNRASFSAHTDPSGKHNLGAYFSINQGTTQSVTATLKFTYSAGMSSSVASSLRFAYGDSGTSAWVFPSTGGSVDTSTRVVSQTTTHFSEWAVFANNATATGTLGSGVSVAANTETTINYGGFDLVVHTTTASTVTLSSYASVVTTMPSGYSALGFSAQAGFTLAIDGGGALIKAELTTPPLTASAAALITG